MASAEQILRKHWLMGRVTNKTLCHTVRVVDLCCELKDFLESKEIKVNWEYLEAAALLHDIAKKLDDKNHQNPFIVENALEHDSLNVRKSIVTHIIMYHKLNGHRKCKKNIEFFVS